jgi:hypothetical protein
VLRIREPDWHEHRMLKGTDPDVNLHVFTLGSGEVERMLLFRNRLRADPRDREHYAAAKRGLSQRTWRYVQQYADAKAASSRRSWSGLAPRRPEVRRGVAGARRGARRGAAGQPDLLVLVAGHLSSPVAQLLGPDLGRRPRPRGWGRRLAAGALPRAPRRLLGGDHAGGPDPPLARRGCV